MNPPQPEEERALQAEQGAKLKLTTMRKPYPRIGKRQWLAEFKLRAMRERLKKTPPGARKGNDAPSGKEANRPAKKG